MNTNLIGEEWFNFLKDEFEKDYFLKLKEVLKKEYATYKVYPRPNEIFTAFKLIEPKKVRIIILGQDPYPFGAIDGPHAHGIAFSSPSSETPASLRTIFREIDRDILQTQDKKEFKAKFPTNNLGCWAKQGILLLNSCLTVRAGLPGSHKSLGWNWFLGSIIERLIPTASIFVTWGKEARDLLALTSFSRSYDPNKQLYLDAGHPATGAKGKDTFSGCNHFSKINRWLLSRNLEPIKWTTDVKKEEVSTSSS